MKNHLTIIGGGLAGWAAAAAFAESDYIIDIFEGENINFGSQQISPNGWLALSNLIEIEKIQSFIEPFNTLQIKSLTTKSNLEILSNFNWWFNRNSYWNFRNIHNAIYFSFTIFAIFKK